MTAYPWTPEIDAEIIAARQRGELLRVIAARLETSRTTLSQHLAKIAPELLSTPRGAPRGALPKPGPKAGVALPMPVTSQSEVAAAKRALEVLRQREGLDAKAERDARIAARRAENDARVQLAHRVAMAEHRAVLTWEALARRHVRSA